MARSLRSDQLSRHLASQPLASLYVVVGDEPLLVTEACDAIRAKARAEGCTERQVFVGDARSDWSQLTAAGGTMSLFGDRQLSELRLPTGKPGKNGGAAIATWIESLGPDRVGLVAMPQPDKQTRSAAWVSALEAAGIWVAIDPVSLAVLPRWIAGRRALANQQAPAEALDWMATQVEGNLLAAHQEVQKLALLYPAGPLSTEQIQQAVMNVARYDVFALREAMLAGDSARLLRMLDGLQGEGEGLPLVLWAVADEIRLLALISEAQAAGESREAIMRRLRVFGDRERGLLDTLKRRRGTDWMALLREAHQLDRLIKGVPLPGCDADPWRALARLALQVC